MDLPRSALEEHCRAGRSRRTRGEDVVDQEEAGRHGSTWVSFEGTGHRPEPLLPGPAGLRRRRLRPTDEGDRGELQPATERSREHTRLVEPALGPPPGGERHPGHGVGRRRAERGQGGRERVADPSPPGELQAVDRRAGGAAVREGRSGGRDRCRRAVPAPIDVDGRGAPAAAAPGRFERDQLTGARGAERPRARAASGARPREEDVDHGLEHGGTLRRAADTAQGSESSTGSPAPLTAIVRIRWTFSSGYAVTAPDPVSPSKLVSRTGSRVPSAASVIAASAPS
jgi:hypothetical protein